MLTYFVTAGRAREFEPDSDYEISENPIIKDYTIPKRPGFGTAGKVANVSVNAYPVTGFPTSAIHQYDVCSYTSKLPMTY